MCPNLTKKDLWDVSKDQVIEKKGTSILVTGLYFILKGSISVEPINVDNVNTETMPMGSTIGAYDYLSNAERQYKYLASTNIVIGRHIPRKGLSKLIQKSKDLRTAIAKVAGMELLNLKFSDFFNNTHQMSEEVCKIMISESKVIYGEDNDDLNLSSTFLLLISGELRGKFRDPTSIDETELTIAKAPLFIHISSKARWSSSGCALWLDPERSKYVYNLEGTMRSNRFTEMHNIQDWQTEVDDIKEELTADFESVNVDYEDGKKMKFADLPTDIELQSSQKHVPM